MAYIKGYRFETEGDVLDKINEINTHYGIPVTSDADTQNWCWYKEHSDGFYYIIAEDSINQFFWETVDIEEPEIL